MVTRKTEKSDNFHENHQCCFSYTQHEEIDENSIPLEVQLLGSKWINKNGIYIYCWLGFLMVMCDMETVGLVRIENKK